jgi:flavorubredoxin
MACWKGPDCWDFYHSISSVEAIVCWKSPERRVSNGRSIQIIPREYTIMPHKSISRAKSPNPAEIAPGVFWIGYADVQTGLHCNPYLIVDGEEAVVIDGGSRPDFPLVMMRILAARIDPSSIVALIYSHYDPDLCGSVGHFENIIGRKDLKIVTEKSNLMFIRHYLVSSRLLSIHELDFRFRFSSGRELRFIRTPYAHSAGSFVTFDERSGILFSSDLFGSYGIGGDLFLNLDQECGDCTNPQPCGEGKTYCPVAGIMKFHRQIMPCEKALRYALEQMATIPFTAIAPQHGRIIREARDIDIIWRRLSNLTKIGIEALTGSRSSFLLDRSK